MRSPDYTRLAAQLPAVYREDEASFAQVDAYLGLADDIARAVVAAIEDAPLTVGPDAALRWPAGLPLDAGPDALVAAQLATYDQLADWAAFTFPAAWGADADGVLKRRELLARAARLWRRRGTPRGFLDWLCFAFDIAPADRPYLLEHFKVRPSVLPEQDLAATLFVVATPGFADFRARREVVEFVAWYAPAHVGMRVCWVRGFTGLTAIPEPPGPLPLDATTAEEDAHRVALATHRADLRALLCSVVSVVDHETGIHIHECIDQGRTVDRLDVGLLPTDD